MANEDRKVPARVQVLTFPKKALRRQTLETALATAKTLPEMRVASEGRRRTDSAMRAPVLADPDGELTEPSGVLERDPPKRGKADRRSAADRRRRPRGQRVEVDTDPALRYSLKKLEQALGKKALGKWTPERVAEVSLFGHRLFEEGRLDEARGVFEGLVSLGVEEAFPHTMLGTVYLALGDQTRALALFEAALALDPADLAARVYRGEIRLNRGRFRLAVEDLRRAVNSGAAEDPFVDRARRLLRMARELARRRTK